MLKKIAINIIFLTAMLISGVSAAAETVNINKASAAAIQQNLIGIGPIKAEAIVSYRKKNGKFSSLDDLQNVTGLGPAIIKKNKRLLSLSKGVTSGDDKAYAAAKKQAGKAKSTGTKKPAKKQASKSTAKTKSTDKSAKSTSSKSTSKSAKTKAKPTKSAKNKCSGSTKTMSKAEKKACAAKSKKKTVKKKSTKTKASKTKKKAKPAT